MHSWRGIAVQVVHRDPSAVLVYLAAGSSDHSGFYSAMGFVKAGEIVEHPYLEGPDDGKLWVQPMLLAGDALARLTASVRMQTIDALDDYRIIRFSNRNRLRPWLHRRTIPLLEAGDPGRVLGLRKSRSRRSPRIERPDQLSIADDPAMRAGSRTDTFPRWFHKRSETARSPASNGRAKPE